MLILCLSKDYSTPDAQSREKVTETVMIRATGAEEVALAGPRGYLRLPASSIAARISGLGTGTGTRIAEPEPLTPTRHRFSWRCGSLPHTPNV